MEIKHLTDEDKRKIIEKHPGAKPKDWVLYDGQLICDYYNTKEQAEADIKNWIDPE